MKELESTRMKLWCDVYVAYVWADIALKRFDETFKEEKAL